MDIPSLKQNIVPLGLLDHVKNIAHVIQLLLADLVIFLNFAQHANNGEQSIFLEFSMETQSTWATCEVSLQKLVLNEWEGC
mgnify:CR=1 FL=1